MTFELVVNILVGYRGNQSIERSPASRRCTFKSGLCGSFSMKLNQAASLASKPSTVRKMKTFNGREIVIRYNMDSGSTLNNVTVGIGFVLGRSKRNNLQKKKFLINFVFQSFAKVQ